MLFFLSVSLLFFCGYVHGRPENLVGLALSTDNGANFFRQLSPENREELAEVGKIFQDLIKAGVGVTLHDFVNLAKHHSPELYRRLAAYEKKVEDEESALPEEAKRFIAARRSEVKGWFPEGVFDKEAFLRSIKLISTDIAAMTEPEKEALFNHYPHLLALLNNPHYKKFLSDPSENEDELLAILQ
uniref:DUF148 domain-containing protein n=1 Tax=Steinernema glaseri TaxID=37863 RepID=A0A1I8AKB9_9BILA